MEVPKTYFYPCAVYTLLMILGTNDQNTCLEYEQVLPFLSLPCKMGAKLFRISYIAYSFLFKGRIAPYLQILHTQFQTKWFFVTKIVLTYCEKKLFSDWGKCLKFEAESQEFVKFEITRTFFFKQWKVSTIFGNRMLF